MKALRSFCCLLSLSVVLSAQVSRTDPQLQKLVGDIRTEVNPAEAMNFMRRIYETDRWFTFSKFKETAEYVQKTMNAIGMRNVEMMGTPADGESQFGFWTVPMAWDVKQATLEIVEPVVPPEMRVLANYQQIPTSLARWSGPTPPGGITAEVVELKPGEERKSLKDIDVKGKMVLVQHRAGLKVPLYKMGAAAMISFDTENPELVDGHLWINSWGDNGWSFTKVSKPLVGFSLTPRQGAYLQGLLGRGKVRVRALVESRYYSGSHYFTTGVLEGSGSGEEVLEIGNTNEQGANDNATGVAAMLESIATLNRLIEAGKLQRPRRNIRVLTMAEMYGSMPYMVKYPERLRNTIGSICLDTPAGPYDEAGTRYTFQMNPDISRSYQDALILRVADNYYAGIQPHRYSNWTAYRTGTDVLQVDPMMGGIPTVKPDSGWGSIYAHHNSADTPDRVDARSMRDLTSILAAYVYYLASAGEGEIPWLSEITAERSYGNIVRAAEPSVDRIASAKDAEALGHELYWGTAKIKHSAECDQKAVLSTLRAATVEQREKMRASMEPLLKSIQRFAQNQSEMLQQSADRRASELGASVPLRAAAPPPDPDRAEASRIIVKRKRIGSITFDDLPVEQREGYPAGGFNVPLITALYWCDGNRNLDEVIRLTELEHGPMDFNFVGYFKFLARHGYVEISTSSK